MASGSQWKLNESKKEHEYSLSSSSQLEIQRNQQWRRSRKTDQTQLSRKLSWLLRHGANESGLQMDVAGWARAIDVLHKLAISAEELMQVVQENNKERYEVREMDEDEMPKQMKELPSLSSCSATQGAMPIAISHSAAQSKDTSLGTAVATQMIRASQGHSLSGTPVTREGLEVSWQCLELGPGYKLYHGTKKSTLNSISRLGLLPGERTHVHLAPSTSSTVGKRGNVEVLLEISGEKLTDANVAVWKAPNGVILAREIPPQCITGCLEYVRHGKGAQSVRSIKWPPT